MNFQRGLERISAVWWSIWGLVGVLLLGATVLGYSEDLAFTGGIGLFFVVGSFLAHKVTCWVVAGFFAPRS